MENSQEYWIYADESVQSGKHFSKFFGGCIIPSTKVNSIHERLTQRKESLGFGKELKWQRVTDQRLECYIHMITAFFEEVRADHLRVRIMFQDNRSSLLRGAFEERHIPYYKLYYQFIKHAFGLAHMPEQATGTRIRIFLDQLPHTKEHAIQFKSFIAALPTNAQLKQKRIKLDPSHITEIDSKDHIILQCVDIVLGAMAFRFNKMHLEKPPGASRRGKRTIAKEKLYKHILSEIRTIKPYFHPKISTAADPHPDGRWSMPYRHWLFTPKK
ncbi:hypothetical protein Rhal01_03748 [Rubritalea halochordaticola]|uniref:DUF3800 domain-containing protein n=1 Tax=Rubritalea halochordaticola TaxID=714537 RepID=A0ABP9V858_9BACT